MAIRCRDSPIRHLSNAPQPRWASANPNYLPVLTPVGNYDLTRGGVDYLYFGHTDVKELALYIEDEIKAGNWDFNLGMREDIYNGLTDANQTEPRLGIAYNIKPSATVLRVSYARTLETPSTKTWCCPAAAARMRCWRRCFSALPGFPGILHPGFRNEFHAGLQQAFGKNVVVSGEYIWKYTHNAFDFSILGNTPIFFPIDWHNSKIPGYALHAEVPNYHGFSAYLGHVFGGGALLPAAGGRRRRDSRPERDYHSASTTTRNSTKPRTCNTRSPTMADG